MFKPRKKSAPGAEKKKRKRHTQDDTIEVVEDVPFKKMSIFFKYLPYWKELAVCHAIDGMHLQKNMFDSTAGFLGISGKVKDGLKSARIWLHPASEKISTPYHILMENNTSPRLATT